MLKKMTIKRVSLASILLFICVLCILFPSAESNANLNIKEDIIYVNTNELVHEIFLINKDNYVARTTVLLEENNTENKIKALIEYLIIGSKKENNIPNGFRAIIPSGTEIIGIDLKDGLLKINFSKEILEIDESLEERMLESIVYSLTTINDIKGILIYVEDELLTVLPKTKINLPTILTRDIGVNKIYDLTNTRNINMTTIYYINSNNDGYYYVPVTKVDNEQKDKIKVIIDELSSGPTYQDNLMSFLNMNTKLLNYELEEKSIELTFNDYIFDNLEEKKLMEEVLYTICLSIRENYDVEVVSFIVNDEEIIKSTIKTLE